MTTQPASPAVTNGSFGLLWTLIARAVGLTAGVAVALLLISALMSTA
jgi:hypothetical protein